MIDKGNMGGTKKTDSRSRSCILYYYGRVLVVILLSLGTSMSILVELELTLTAKEKVAFDQLKGQLETKHALNQTELQLIRWLRASDLDVNEARRRIEQNAEWRQTERMDSILSEDWSFFKRRFYMDESGTDREGRPVVTADVSEWDVRSAVLNGQGDHLVRYMIRGIEAASRRVLEAQKLGQNVTQWQVILNMDRFNLMQHGCLQCLPVYLSFIQAHELQYPFGADRIITINTPASFEIVLTLLRPIMSPAMRDAFISLGRDKKEWRKVVLDLISPDQLAPHFGGTKDED